MIFHKSSRKSAKPWSSATRKIARLLWAFVIWAALSASPSRAQAADLNGTWQASSLRVSWSVGDWGKVCGARPSGGGEPGGTVTLTQTGSDFELSGLGRSYKSSQCWEQMPGLGARSHSAGSNTIQTTCTMPAGDPRQAKVVSTWYPRGDEIYFDETGQYQSILSGSNCTASVRRTRVLRRVVATPVKESVTPAPLPAPAPTQAAAPKPAQAQAAAPQSAPAPKSAPAPTPPETAPPPAPLRGAQCASPGAAVQLEVTPKHKLMRSGEKFLFQAIARDKNGCRVPIETTWRLLSGKGGTLDRSGELSVGPEALTETLQIEAQVGEQKVQVSAKIVSEEEYEKLLAGGEYGVLGESLDALEITLSRSHVEFDAEESGTDERKNRLVLLFGGILVLFLLGATYLLLRKRQAKPTSLHEELQESTPKFSDPPIVPAPPAAAPPPRLCPVCGKRYEDGTLFCGEDGARLLRAN